MAEYRFVTVWRLQQPIQRVWTALNMDCYSQWWPSMISYRNLTPDLTGVGSKHERVVKGRLPYHVRYVTTLTKVEPPCELAYEATGDLNGDGRMVFTQTDDWTEVTFYWNVRTAKGWMNWFAFLLRPILSWNHHRVMAEGERGLAKWLKDPA